MSLISALEKGKEMSEVWRIESHKALEEWQGDVRGVARVIVLPPCI